MHISISKALRSLAVDTIFHTCLFLERFLLIKDLPAFCISPWKTISQSLQQAGGWGTDLGAHEGLLPPPLEANEDKQRRNPF